MYENLRGRVGRIISVGVSAVLGAIEGLSPEKVMEQALGEVDDATREVREELDRVLASRHMAEKRLAEKNARHKELDDQIARAVAESRDDLAEAGIAHQLDIEAQAPVLRSALDDLGRKEQELHSYIGALAAKKREMQEELARLRAARSSTPAAGVADQTPGLDKTAVGRKVDRAASAFERAMTQQTGLPAENQSALTDQAKLAELDKLSRDNRIRERLAAVKAARKQD